jgi:hypothetical protein
MKNFCESDIFQRCPHDPENPWSQVSKDLIRDSSISFECRGLLIYLLSMKDGWVINTKQLINHASEFAGKDKIYSIINEAIKAGYLMRREFLVNGLKRYSYLLSEFPKFKKCLLYPENPDAENPDSKEELKEKKKKKYIKEIKPPPSPDRSTLSADADVNLFFASLLLEKIKKIKPNFIGKITPKWLKNTEAILKLRSPEKLRKIIDWVSESQFWQGVILSPANLLCHLDRIEIQMVGKKTPESKSEENKKFAQAIKEKFPNNNDFDVYPDHVGFKFGPNKYVALNYSENGFEEQMKNNLRKMKIFL